MTSLPNLPKLTTGAGSPSIAEAPEVRIALSPHGRVSVWVSGVGYLDDLEAANLGRLLLTRGEDPEAAAFSTEARDG